MFYLLSCESGIVFHKNKLLKSITISYVQEKIMYHLANQSYHCLVTDVGRSILDHCKTGKKPGVEVLWGRTDIAEA